MTDLDARARSAADTLDSIAENQSGTDKLLTQGSVISQIVDYAVEKMREAKVNGTLPTSTEAQNDFLAQHQLDLALKINQYDNKGRGYNIVVDRKPDGRLKSFGFEPAKK